jgi:curved DNA-binding protein CbpA
MKDPYSILGISRDATDEEVKSAYKSLARKYHPGNYDDNNPLKDLANEKMQEINAAYDEIQSSRASSSYDNFYNNNTYGGNSSSGTSGVYREIRDKINQRKYKEAEQMLFSVDEYDRTADWHFLISVIYMQKGRSNDAMRELEIACNMDPTNMEYQKAKEMFNNSTGRYGSMYNSTPYRRSTDVDACDCCYKLWCLDCICECMGGDFIRCI